MKDVTITDCTAVHIDSTGNLEFVVSGEPARTAVRFDLGQTIAVSRDGSGLLRVEIGRDAPTVTGKQ